MGSTRTSNKMVQRIVFVMMLFISTISFSSELIVGVPTSGLPLAEKINSSKGPYFFGYIIDIVNNICARIGKICVFKEVTLQNEFDLLNSGKIDILVLARPYVPLDQKLYATSIPYAVSEIEFIATKKSPINKIADINHKKIGAIKSTFYNLLLQSPYGKKNQIIPFDNMFDLIADLLDNKVDVIVLNKVIGIAVTHNKFYNFKVVGDSPLGNGYGLIGLPDKKLLIMDINKAILEMEKNGIYVLIYQKYQNLY